MTGAEFDAWKAKVLAQVEKMVVPRTREQWNELEALLDEHDPKCGCCCGTGFVVRDPDIGTDQECFCCNGSGRETE